MYSTCIHIKSGIFQSSLLIMSVKDNGETAAEVNVLRIIRKKESSTWISLPTSSVNSKSTKFPSLVKSLHNKNRVQRKPVLNSQKSVWNKSYLWTKDVSIYLYTWCHDPSILQLFGDFRIECSRCSFRYGDSRCNWIL